MPELPEVETIRRALEPELRGRVIARVRVRRPDVIGHPKSVWAFTRRLSGCRFNGLSRRGKYLLFEFCGGSRLVVHLRLSGHLVFVEGRREAPKYERVRLELDDGRPSSSVEPSALGRMYCLLPGETPEVLANMRAMGPEPLERGFGSSHLAGWFRGRMASVKALLLDQRICCGVGNIYSDEALFRAGIRPTRTAATLSRAEVSTLARHLRNVLSDAIRWSGTTMEDGRYLRPDGREGGFQSRLAVFGREGQQCLKCRSTIRTAAVAGRTSHYCPRCQR